jgi:hypothetical protein
MCPILHLQGKRKEMGRIFTTSMRNLKRATVVLHFGERRRLKSK